jgi:hypothetical protein
MTTTDLKQHKKGLAMNTVNRLHLNQSIQVADWLKDRPAYDAGTPIQQIADEATDQLGFEVNRQNIRTVAKAVGFALPAARAPKVDPVAHLDQIVILLAERIAKLEDQVARLENINSNTLHLAA